MTFCIRCGSERVADVCAKTNDLCGISVGEQEHNGYVPTDMGIGEDSDYVEFTYCLNCGQMQDSFPLPTTELEQS